MLCDNCEEKCEGYYNEFLGGCEEREAEMKEERARVLASREVHPC